ncbi:MAG TPA: sulfatase, partial [Thermoanaerobaculia bacterium]|nr:sulfatase [Thermoanaerobaculia bacterium]
MAARTFLVGSMVVSMVILSGCGGSSPSAAPAAVRLADVFADGMVVDPLPVVEPARSEWRLTDLADDWTWRAPAGVAGAVVGEDGLRGTVEMPRPVVVLAAPAELGDGDQLHAIEVRMRVSEGESLELTVLGEDGPPAEAFAGEEVPLALSTPLVPGDEMTTYRIEMVRSMVLGPFARRGARRVVLRPSERPGAEFVLESVRLVFHREHLATVPSGLGWHGLGDVWRETLVSRPGETLRLPLRVPAERPVLDLSLGTPEDAPLRFEVSVGEGDRRRRILKRTVTQPERWEDERVDLAQWAGREVVLELRAECDEAATVALWGSPALRSRGAGVAAADAEAPQGVILVIADTLRRDHLDAWGYGRPTAPNLSRLAAEGVRFEDTVAQAVWTKVSVPSILSSLYPTAHRIVTFTDRLPAAATTLAEAFQSAGYATMATSAWAFTGQLTNLHQGVEVLYEGGSVDLPEGASGTKTARFFVDRVTEFVERHREQPFLAVVHTGDPHSPYEPLGRWADLWIEPDGRQRHREELDRVMPHIESDFFRRFKLPTAADLERAGLAMEPWRDHEIGWYDGSIRGLDAELGRLVDRLDHLGLTDRVVIAFVSDHGEEFFEHGRNWHGLNLYGHQTDVPFVLWGPGHVPGGVVVAPPVQLIDVMPTLLAVAGLDRPELLQGRDLMPLVAAARAGEPGPRARPAFSERTAQGIGPGFPPDTLANSWAVLTSEWRLIRNPDPPPGVPEYELYARRDDPLALTDVAD